jgi:hypothetical protein
MTPKLQPVSSLVISYVTLRRAIGVLGLLFPFLVSLGALLIFGTGLQESISAYYYTGTRDVFVGSLWAIGFFLFSYRGYEIQDRIAGKLAWAFALGVALFPTSPDCQGCSYSHVASFLHGVFAAALFLTLSYFSLVLFTKTDPSRPPTPQKLQRNMVYRICGWIMLVCIALILIIKFNDAITSAIGKYDPVFYLETITILSFGVSWLIKGEVILADQ